MVTLSSIYTNSNTWKDHTICVFSAFSFCWTLFISWTSDNDDLQSIFDVDSGAFLTCRCTTCQRASQCDCQTESEITNERGHKLFAYYGVSISFCRETYWQLVQGLFAFCIPQGVEVIECNKVQIYLRSHRSYWNHYSTAAVVHCAVIALLRNLVMFQ